MLTQKTRRIHFGDNKQLFGQRNAYLGAPLALNADIGGYLAVPTAHQLSQAVDLVLFVDIDFQGQVGSVPQAGPGEESSVGQMDKGIGRAVLVSCWAGTEGAVQEAGEEEGGGNEEEGADLVGTAARSVVEHSRLVGWASHSLAASLSASQNSRKAH